MLSRQTSICKCRRLFPTARFTSLAGSAEPPEPQEPQRLTPAIPKGAPRVPIPAFARFAKGLTGPLVRYLRTPQVDVNFDFRNWAEHHSAYRNLKMWLPWNVVKATNIKRILFPDVAWVGFSASLVTYYNNVYIMDQIRKVLDTDGDGEVSAEEIKEGIANGVVSDVQSLGGDFFLSSEMFTLPLTPFTLTSVALGMMLTFRTQNCNARYTEARILWGGMVNESRAVTARILAHLSPEPPASGALARAPVHAVKCVMTFPHTLKYHLTVDGFCPDIDIRLDMTDAEVNAAKALALRKELETIWDYSDKLEKEYVERLLAPGVASRPLHVLQEIAEINAQVFAKPTADGGAGLDSIHVNEISRSLTRFQDVLGACERVYKTPIYTAYTSFTQRCIWIWCNLLPLGLYPTLGPVGTIPTSMVVALFMYGLEDVGSRIEEPFDVLPLWQYCEGIDGSCKQMLAQHAVLKQVPR